MLGRRLGAVDSDKAALGKIASLTFGGSAGGKFMPVAGGWANGSGSTDTQGDNKPGITLPTSPVRAQRDFRQGKDMVQSYRVSHSGSHTDNTRQYQLDQLGATPERGRQSIQPIHLEPESQPRIQPDGLK